MPIADERPMMLLVDDDPHVLSALERNLKRDFRVVATDSGWSALQALSADAPVEVVVTDWHMPHMSGGEFLNWMVDLFPNVPRIVFTGDAAPVELDSVLRSMEVYDVLFKPVGADTIRERALAAIAHARSRQIGGVPVIDQA